MTPFKRIAAVLGATALSVGLITTSFAGGTGSVKGDGKDLVMFTITASNVYGANQIKGA